MDTTINRLIRLNVELEGTLRVAAERISPEAIEAAREKFNEMTALFPSLDSPNNEKDTAEKPAESEFEKFDGMDVTPIAKPDENDIQKIIKPIGNDTTSAASKPIAVDHNILKSDIRKAFTLNDKFRFRRELFAGNEAEFSDTLDLFATMHSLEEAEEYIYDDLQWSRDDETIAEFMGIVGNFFNLRK